MIAIGKMALGVILTAVATWIVGRDPRFVGWIGMVGIAFTLHFGLFHLLSVAWRHAGVDAPPIMNAPILASSLSESWAGAGTLLFVT